MKRMTDEEFALRFHSDHHSEWGGELVAEAQRARAEEVARDARIARLVAALGAAREALGRAQAHIGWGTQPRLECGRAYDAATGALEAE
jgi:hypothetical protein